MYSTGYCCPILMKLEFSWQILENILKYKISWKSIQWEPSVPCRRTGGQDEPDSRFFAILWTHQNLRWQMKQYLL
jgi:hypothetical protein